MSTAAPLTLGPGNAKSMAKPTFEIEYAPPTLVHVEHEGRKYLVRLAVHVFDITATGASDANGIPLFNLAAAPVVMVTPEPDA